ncbi:MAG: LPXTG cell wall anchor domain-containing protein [Acidimicrobiales bacterium]
MIKRIAAAMALSALGFLAIAGPTAAQTGPSGLPTPGASIAVTCTASTTSISCQVTGLLPGSSFTLTIASTPQLLATGVADASGVGNTTTALPCGLDSGTHTVTAVGTDSLGAPGSASTTVNLGGTSACAGATPPLARTGASNTREYVGAGLAAIATGGLLLVGARKRRRALVA